MLSGLDSRGFRGKYIYFGKIWSILRGLFLRLYLLSGNNKSIFAYICRFSLWNVKLLKVFHISNIIYRFAFTSA